jgi:hypothetical protein
MRDNQYRHKVLILYTFSACQFEMAANYIWPTKGFSLRRKLGLRGLATYVESVFVHIPRPSGSLQPHLANDRLFDALARRNKHRRGISIRIRRLFDTDSLPKVGIQQPSR